MKRFCSLWLIAKMKTLNLFKDLYVLDEHEHQIAGGAHLNNTIYCLQHLKVFDTTSEIWNSDNECFVPEEF